jgi:SAM-dependent methyltransferase
MSKIEERGFRWHGFDRQSWGRVREWDISKPCEYRDCKADVVFLLDVIEHCSNPGLAIRNLADVLEDGGSLILTTPNPKWSASRIQYFFRGVLSGFSEQDLVENYHVFTPWPHIMERFMRDAGLQIDYYATLDGCTSLFRADGRLFRPLRYMLNTIQTAIELRDRSARGMSYGMVARKVGGEPAPYSIEPC